MKLMGRVAEEPPGGDLSWADFLWCGLAGCNPVGLKHSQRQICECEPVGRRPPILKFPRGGFQ
jgi:hypothetical protein